MRRHYQATVGTLAALLALGPAMSWAAEPAELLVRVEDHGKAKAGLTAENFRVREGDQTPILKTAEPAGAASVVLLIENSEASWKYLNEVNSAMKGFLKTAPPWHSYSLVSYSQDPKVEAPMTTQASQVAAAYAGRKQSAWGRVAAYDALDRVLDEVEKLEGFRVVVMIGSGEDAFSRTGLRDLVHRVEAMDVVIYTVQLGGSGVVTQGIPPGLEDLRDIVSLGSLSAEQGPDLSRGELFLRAVARVSGGEFSCPNCEAGYRTAVEEIVESLDAFYRLGYSRETEPEAGLAKLSVQAFRLDDDVRYDYKVKVRPGWRF